jgi:hypothetical protein
MTIEGATVASIPGTVINRNTSARSSATRASSASINRNSPGVEVQLPQQRRRRGQLITRQRLGRQPSPALVPEQIRGRAARNQVAVQDRVHLVLQPGSLTHQMRPPQHLTTHRGPRPIRPPHPRQEIRRQQPRQDPRINPVNQCCPS